jgi:hypothetical protein
LGICCKIDAYELSRKNTTSQEIQFFVSIKDDGAYLNGVKVIDKAAKLQFAIFKILTDLYFEEFYTAMPKYISISRICSLLESKGMIIDDAENQIRVAIYYIRTSIKTAFKHMKNNSIIESQKWKGYRLSNDVLLKRF